jgi:hypothetical protein
MEDRSWMQKKKPSFQVIPNYGINAVPNWNESKEVPAEQGLQGYRPAQALRPRQAVPYARSTPPNFRGDRALKPELHIPHLKMVRRNSGCPRITAALFIEHSSEI